MAAMPRLAVGVVVVISPQPLTPSSVRTSTNRYSPHPVPSAPTSHGTSPVIFIPVSSPPRVSRRDAEPADDPRDREGQHRPVRVGVVILPQFRWPEARARWVSLEQRGFAHGWTYDHLAWRDLADEPWYATVPTLVAAATATSTLRLGTWVASPNYRHPVTTAKDLMTLDDISGGRLIAAIGAGGLGWDARVLGQDVLDPRERVARLDEFITLTDVLLRQPDTTWTGHYYQARNAKMVPAGSRARI